MDAQDLALLYEEAREFGNVEVSVNEMSPRERFLNIMSYTRFDRVIDTEFGYWPTTLKRWHNEGMPKYVNDNVSADLFFGFDQWQKRIPAKFGLHPEYLPEVVSDNGRTKIVYNQERIRMEIFSEECEAGSMPHFLEFPVKDRDTYKKLFKERLAPKPDERLPDLGDISQQVTKRNYVLSVFAGSTAGKIRDWMGFESLCMAIYDQPDLLDEILEDVQAQMCAVAEDICKALVPDLIFWWEDIAFKNGPIVTPKFFIEKCGKVIASVMNIYRNAGCQFGYVDCDGDFRKLLPAWTENGVNILFPLEVGAGMHPIELRKQFPGLRMMGGVDKAVLKQGHDRVRKELMSLKAIVEEGGYIPHVDHRVPDDVSYQDYLYYLNTKREIFGIEHHQTPAIDV